MTKTLYINGHLYGRATDELEAIVVQDGKIEAIGGQKELKLQLSGQHYEIVDWQGGHVFPGLVDSHMHLSMHGMKLSMLDFSAASSRREMLDMLRRKAETTSSGEWILGLNWNENAFPDRMAPHISELDEITSTHPVFLTRTCFHAFLANTEAFRRAGIHKDTPDPASGSFGRDEYGELNGWVYEEASFLFQKVQPEPDYESKKQMIRQASQDALRLGLTGVHTEDLRLHGSVETMLRIHREMLEEGIALRTHHLLYHPFLEEAVGLGLHGGSGDEWLKMGSVKLFVDGAIGGRTALLREPYYDDDQTMGMAIHSLDGLEKLWLRQGRQAFRLRRMPLAMVRRIYCLRLWRSTAYQQLRCCLIDLFMHRCSIVGWWSGCRSYISLWIYSRVLLLVISRGCWSEWGRTERNSCTHGESLCRPGFLVQVAVMHL